MKTIFRLLLISMLSVSAWAEIPELPANLIEEMKKIGLEKKAESQISKDDFQAMFAGGTLEKVFKHLDKLEDASSYQFQDAKGVGVSLMRLRFATPLSEEDIRELASIEALTLEKSLERMKMAKFFVDFVEVNEPKTDEGNFSDSFSYSLQEAGKKDKIRIMRARHYGPNHLIIVTAVNSDFKLARLQKWSQLLPETKLQPKPVAEPLSDEAEEPKE